MKIISHGTIEKNWIGQCPQCGAVLKIQESELADPKTARIQGWAWKGCLSCKILVCFYSEESISAQLILNKVRRKVSNERKTADSLREL